MVRWSVRVQLARGPTAATNCPTFVAHVALRIRPAPMDQNVLSSRGTEDVVAAGISRLDVRAGSWEMCRMMKHLAR